MNEAALAAFADATANTKRRWWALPRCRKVPIDVADRLMAGERADPVLILCKAAEWTGRR